MTVAELIDALRKCDPDAIVAYDDGEDIGIIESVDVQEGDPSRVCLVPWELVPWWDQS